MNRPFYFRIDLIDLMDFATEPAGTKMTLLEFAKELRGGNSKHPAIQRIIDEAHNYIEKKKIAGSKGGSSAKAKRSSAVANGSTPLASNRNSNNKEKQKPPLVQEMDIPSWMPLKDWNDFLEARKNLKKPMSPLAMTRMISKLDRLRGDYCLTKLLDRAIRNGWQDVYEDDSCKLDKPRDHREEFKKSLGGQPFC